jgi:hypothetical protein
MDWLKKLLGTGVAPTPKPLTAQELKQPVQKTVKPYGTKRSGIEVGTADKPFSQKKFRGKPSALNALLNNLPSPRYNMYISPDGSRTMENDDDPNAPPIQLGSNPLLPDQQIPSVVRRPKGSANPQYLRSRTPINNSRRI